jgi:hypothetical protein
MVGSYVHAVAVCDSCFCPGAAYGPLQVTAMLLLAEHSYGQQPQLLHVNSSAHACEAAYQSSAGAPGSCLQECSRFMRTDLHADQLVLSVTKPKGH